VGPQEIKKVHTRNKKKKERKKDKDKKGGGDNSYIYIKNIGNEKQFHKFRRSNDW
jgi:hypothetical protein